MDIGGRSKAYASARPAICSPGGGPTHVSLGAQCPVNSTLTATLQASPKALSTFAKARIIYAMRAWVWSGATVH